MVVVHISSNLAKRIRCDLFGIGIVAMDSWARGWSLLDGPSETRVC